MAANSGFTFPFFYTYPPYFTLQPIKETRDRQIALWCSLVLAFCQHNKVYVLDAHKGDTLFTNLSINRSLSLEARIAVIEELVSQGRAEWLDKGKTSCYVFWKRVDEWASAVLEFVRTYGLSDSVMTVDDLCKGDDVRGTEIFGLNRDILLRALKLLESQGKVRLFKGNLPEEEGVKFL